MQKRILSGAEQVAECLRDEILRGRWSGTLPGIHRLSAELGFSRKPVERALPLLEKEGILVAQGVGRRRRIVLPEDAASPTMRIALLNYDPAARNEPWCIQLLHDLTEQGHTALIAGKTLVELGMRVRRVAHLVERTEADAWIITAAPHEILDWFAGRDLRAFALFGSWDNLPLPGVGPEYLPALLAMTRRVLELGHQRVVFLMQRGKRESEPTHLRRVLMGELESHGIRTGSYNVPGWEDSCEGFQRLLESLFEVTPPTALIIEELPHFVATLQFCARQGIRVPEDLSLACFEAHAEFGYCTPPVAHIRWDFRPIIRRVLRWADHVARGRKDCRRSHTKAEFVDGGTLGRVPRRAE